MADDDGITRLDQVRAKRRAPPAAAVGEDALALLNSPSGTTAISFSITPAANGSDGTIRSGAMTPTNTCSTAPAR